MSTYKDNTPFTVGRGFSRLADHSNGAWTTGVVFTPHGLVTVYAQGDSHKAYITELNWLDTKTGVVHERQYDSRLTSRGIAAASRRFAKEKAGAK